MKPTKSLVAVAVLICAAATARYASAAAADDELPPPPVGSAAPASHAPAAQPVEPPAAPAAKSGDEASKPKAEIVGPLELTAIKATARAFRINASTCVASNLRLRVKNASTSDVKVALLMPDVGASDDLGQNLLGNDPRLFRVSGVTAMPSPPRNGWVNFLGENDQNLTTLSPGQTVEVQIAPGNPGDWRSIACVNDPNSDMMRTYRPTSYSLSGSIGVVDLDGNAQVRSFSLLDVPLQVTVK